MKRFLIALILVESSLTAQVTYDRILHAVALKPDFAASYALLGKLLLQGGHVSDAARELEHAIQLRPDYLPAHLYLGHAYRKLGREADAAREFQLVRKLNDEQSAQPSLRYHQGDPPK